MCLRGDQFLKIPSAVVRPVGQIVLREGEKSAHFANQKARRDFNQTAPFSFAHPRETPGKQTLFFRAPNPPRQTAEIEWSVCVPVCFGVCETLIGPARLPVPSFPFHCSTTPAG